VPPPRAWPFQIALPDYVVRFNTVQRSVATARLYEKEKNIVSYNVGRLHNASQRELMWRGCYKAECDASWEAEEGGMRNLQCGDDGMRQAWGRIK
jgi:hypothetical protein